MTNETGAMSKTLCIYHANCADGLGAAWAVHKGLGPNVEMENENALSAEAKPKVIWSHSELADLFGLTIGLSLPEGAVKHLQGKLATALQGDTP